MMTLIVRLGIYTLAVLVSTAALSANPGSAAADLQTTVGIEYRVLATSRTSTMEKELNAAAEDGYRYRTVMGGETALGGSEVVVVMAQGEKGRYVCKLPGHLEDVDGKRSCRMRPTLVSNTSGKPCSAPRWVATKSSSFSSATRKRTVAFDYKLVATSKTSTLQGAAHGGSGRLRTAGDDRLANRARRK